MSFVVVDTDFLWDLNTDEAPRHYFRVTSQNMPRAPGTEGSSIPGPITDDCDSEGGGGSKPSAASNTKSVAWVLARNVAEVAEKLIDEDWIDSVSSVCRQDPSAIPPGEGDRILVDVTEEFFGAVESLRFIVDDDLSIEAESDFVADDNPTEYFSVEASGGLELSGTAPYTVTFNPSEFFLYQPVGGLVIGGSSVQKQQWWSYTASGGISVGSLSSTKPTFQSRNRLFLTLGGHATSIIVGTQDLESKSAISTSTEARAIYQPVEGEEIEDDQFFGVNVETACCPDTRTPVRLTMTHNFDKLEGFSDFIVENNLTLPDEVPLGYTTVGDSWQSNLLFQGIGANSGQQWQLITEWKCVVPDVSAIDSTSYWRYSLTATYADHITAERKVSRLILVFDKDIVCFGQMPLRFAFTFDPRTVQSDPVSVLAPTFSDGAAIFKSNYWLTDVTQPTLDLKVTSVSGAQSLNYRYPEITTPIGDVRSRAPGGIPQDFTLVE